MRGVFLGMSIYVVACVVGCLILFGCETSRNNAHPAVAKAAQTVAPVSRPAEVDKPLPLVSADVEQIVQSIQTMSEGRNNVWYIKGSQFEMVAKNGNSMRKALWGPDRRDTIMGGYWPDNMSTDIKRAGIQIKGRVATVPIVVSNGFENRPRQLTFQRTNAQWAVDSIAYE